MATQQNQPQKKTPALFLEGGDSVGKNELFRSVAKQVLLANPSKKLLLMNFPQFWFFGHDIRLVIRGACDDLLQRVTGWRTAISGQVFMPWTETLPYCLQNRT